MHKKFLLIVIGRILITSGFLFLWHFSAITRIDISSKKILDRNHILLREICSSPYGTAYPVTLKDLPGHFQKVVLTTEDKRFYYHLGVDPLALARAARQNFTSGKTVSGGSTITQQLVRNIYHYPRTFKFKIWEAIRAVCIELRYSKNRILEEYLNRIPYGNGAYGVETAARLYFAKSARDLTLAESAFLCAIPASNKMYDPYRKLNLTIKRQQRILKLMLSKDKINHEEYEIARSEVLTLFPRERKFLAPHFCEWIRQKYGSALPAHVITTLDYNLQRKVAYIINNHLSRLNVVNVNNAAAIVIDNHSSEILALVGSADFFDELHDGQVNGVLALRQPGSSLKPFVYSLALESGFTSSSTVPDIESAIKIKNGSFFIPQNYDKKYHGMVRLRTALACSYNIATVNLAAYFGPQAVLNKLLQAGFEHLNKPADFYGPGLCLGTGEITLVELARAYSALANKGRLRELRLLMDEPEEDKGLMFNQQIAFILTDILSDNSARIPAFGEFSPLNMPFKCAAKTGTSKDFRDNWTAGFTPRYTVAVWVGNFNGAPMYSVSGITGAGPIFRDIMLTLEINNGDSDFTIPDNLEHRKICAKSGKLPNAYCPEQIEEYFIKGTAPKEKCSIHKLHRIDNRNGLLAAKDCPKDFISEKVFEVYPIEYYDWASGSGVEMPPYTVSALDNKSSNFYCSIEFPKNGDVFKIDPVLRREYQSITLKPKLRENVETVKWIIDNQTILADKYPFTTSWVIEPGKHKINYEATSGDQTLKSENIEVVVLP